MKKNFKINKYYRLGLVFTIIFLVVGNPLVEKFNTSPIGSFFIGLLATIGVLFLVMGRLEAVGKLDTFKMQKKKMISRVFN